MKTPNAQLVSGNQNLFGGMVQELLNSSCARGTRTQRDPIHFSFPNFFINSLTVGKRLILRFAVVLFILLILGAWAYLAMFSIKAVIDMLQTASAPGAEVIVIGAGILFFVARGVKLLGVTAASHGGGSNHGPSGSGQIFSTCQFLTEGANEQSALIADASDSLAEIAA